VTREWYDARRAQLSAANGAGPLQRVWTDPLTTKKFYSENTYETYVRSKKYTDLVKKSGQPAPAAIISVRRLNEPAEQPQAPGKAGKPAGFVVKPASHGGPAGLGAEDEDMEDGGEGSDWETASEEDEAAAGEGGDDAEGEWEEWDVRRSLFDNHVSESMEANLEYMWRKFGFYLPDSEYLEDPEGMLQYLGVKMQYGHIPLYESGTNPKAKQMASLHGVQRHMVDVGKCKVLYDGNEDEYEDFYNYEKADMEEDGAEASSGRALALIDTDDAAAAGGGYELALPGNKGGVKVLGSREFARYYRQKHRAGDNRGSTAAARVVAQYRKLAVPLLGDGTVEVDEKKRVQKANARVFRMRMLVSLRRNHNDNLPRNVPY
jgi:pre-60S factor REI1